MRTRNNGILYLRIASELDYKFSIEKGIDWDFLFNRQKIELSYD